MKNFKLYRNTTFLLGMLLVVLLSFLASCKKETPKPIVKTTKDSTVYVDPYSNGGVLPDWTSGNVDKNELVGTTWVLTKIMNGFGTTIMHDTLHFVTKNKYYVNSDTTNSASYTLYSAQNTMSLTFKPLISVNHIFCSTNELGLGFASGTQIIGVQFKDPYNTSNTFKAWFTKL
jgi:hypothetical protein